MNNNNINNILANDENHEPSFIGKVLPTIKQRFQRILDISVPHIAGRWIFFALMLVIYGYRVYVLQGFYIVTYGLGIFLLNLLIGFLSPLDDDLDGPSLPTTNADVEFKPFIRRLPEFKFWYSCTKAVIIAFFMTFFNMFNIPVFWPILLVYFIVLFFLTMKRQIKHMIQHKYVPFSYGKKQYGKKEQQQPSSLGLGSIVGNNMGKMKKDNK